MVRVLSIDVTDVRFPTSEGMHGSDAMHPDPDYSCSYVVLHTDTPHRGHGLTFTIGRGNDIVCAAIEALSPLVVGRTLEDVTSDFGAFCATLVNDSQLRWIGPEKGVIALAAGALINTMWDLYAKVEGKPLWRLLYDMTPEQIVSLIDFRWISDALSKEEALSLLRKGEVDKEKRLEVLMENGLRAYTTSAGWLGYTEQQLREKCKAGVAEGWHHFKAKVGVSLEEDVERIGIIRDEIGPDRMLMVDANQRWDVPVAIEWMKQLAPFKPYFIEEPTCADDVLGHLTIRQALAPYGIKVASGEVAHNRVMFKQFITSGALDVVQIDACRVAGVNEVLTTYLMACKFGKEVWPHAGGVGLCEYVQHLAMFDFLKVSGKERVIEYVNHLHEHFKYPVVIRNGRYLPPLDPGYSIEMKPSSVSSYTFPHGCVWTPRILAKQLDRAPAQQNGVVTWLITGANGFVGAYTIKALLSDPVHQSSRIVAHDLRRDDHLWSQILTEAEMCKIERVFCDIAETLAIRALMLFIRPTFIIHLAGLQIPTCRANPSLGAKVNVLGFTSIFDSARALKVAGTPVQSVVYASSAAVCGPADDYDSVVPEDANHKPQTHYGAYKLCNEATARVYWIENQIPSAGLRPLTVIGIGREVGATSAPVKCIKNAVIKYKEKFEIPFCGETSFIDVRDVAKAFIVAAQNLKSGAVSCAMKGHVTSVEKFLNLAESLLPELKNRWRIADNAVPLPFPSQFDQTNLVALLGEANLPSTSLSDSIQYMVDGFKELQAAGKLDASDLN